MRIVSGKLKGRQLKINPKDPALRPTTERVREAIFSTLQALTAMADATVLDLYAGTGSLGLEALSRGARLSVFVEQRRQTFQLLKLTLQELKLTGQSAAYCADVLKFLAQRKKENSPFDLIFADPPYADQPLPELERLLVLGQWVQNGSLLVVESAAKGGISAGEGCTARSLSLRLLKDKIYGDTLVRYFVFENH